MAKTHRCMILSAMTRDEEGSAGCAVWDEYPAIAFDMRIRTVSPPGEAQPVENLISKPNLTPFYVESDWPTINLIAADPDYPLIQPIEEIPVDVF